jgi:hypothetical protein
MSYSSYWTWKGDCSYPAPLGWPKVRRKRFERLTFGLPKAIMIWNSGIDGLRVEEPWDARLSLSSIYPYCWMVFGACRSVIVSVCDRPIIPVHISNVRLATGSPGARLTSFIASRDHVSPFALPQSLLSRSWDVLFTPRSFITSLNVQHLFWHRSGQIDRELYPEIAFERHSLSEKVDHKCHQPRMTIPDRHWY